MAVPEPKSNLEMLQWQLAMGVDEAVGDTAADWFERSEKALAQKKNAGQRAPQPVGHTLARIERPRPAVPQTGAAKPIADQDNAIGEARQRAQGCSSVEDLVATLTTFEGCPLSRTATNLCFIDGNHKARILLIGEAPGRDEDLQGKPFVGRSGQLLDKMIGHIGLSRDQQSQDGAVLISNTVFWRPPGNRKPTEAETLMCLPFVNKLIELVAPEVIVCLGATPTQRLTGQTKGITRLRGRWFDYDLKGKNIPVLATLHPAYLLRQPAQKSLAWRDLITLKKQIDSMP